MPTSHGDHPATAHRNRLAEESSPYLLLHRHNPVDWYPWGDEALDRARREDKPIFLSVGYSTCYWCHVMERESFADETTAELMNREFVNVKLDREERPDLDEVYMTATQILTGQGGWPNSVFLTPDLKPFYAGTYFPPDDRYGRPGFKNLLAGLAHAWRHRRDEVRQQAEELAAALRRYLEDRVRPGEAPPGPQVVAACFAALERRFDPEWAGFSTAPKFPTPSNLFFLLDLAESGREEAGRAGEMLAATLDQMARGGIFDQLAGGFHRYATDRAWRVPHFEKMLYDNALLLELYAREHARTGDPETARVARATVGFLAREMTLPDGGFASAIDAETDGHEGAFHVWTADELSQVLGDEGHAFLAPLYGFAGEPFFEERHYVLHLPEPLAAAAERRRTTREDLLADIEPLRRRLLAAREERKRPLTDDKVLADWNGMTIAALATAGRLLGEPEWVERAARAADFVLDRMRSSGGPLLHAWREGSAKVPAMLADYAWMLRGLLALDRADGGDRWLAAAGDLGGEMVDRLADPAGGFWVSEARPDLLVRSKELFDGAVPAANGVAVLDLLALAERTGEERWAELAAKTLAAAGPLVEQFPDGARTMVLATRRWREWTGVGEQAEAGEAGEAGSGAEVRGDQKTGKGGAESGVAAATARVGGEAGTAEDIGRREETGEEGVERRAAAGERAARDVPAVEDAGDRSGGGGRPATLAEETERAVEAALAAGEPDADGRRPFRLTLTIAPGWHLNAHRPTGEAAASLIATSLRAEGAELEEVEYPEGERGTVPGAGDDLAVYAGTVEIAGVLGPASGAEPSLIVTYQPCDDRRCLPPVERRLPLVPEAGVRDTEGDST